MQRRFFFRLFIVVLVSGMLGPLILMEIPGQAILSPLVQRMYHFYLSSSSAVASRWLSESPSEAVMQARLRVLKELYPIEIQRHSEVSARISEDQKQALKNREMFYVPEVDAFWAAIPDTPYYLSMANPETDARRLFIDSAIQSTGVLYLIQQQLETRPESQWEAHIGQLAASFPYPLHLISLENQTPDSLIDETALNPVQWQGLIKGEVTTITGEPWLVIYGNWTNYYMQRVPGSDKVVLAGPILPPMRDWLSSYLIISSLYKAGLVLLLLALWMWPTWRAARVLLLRARAFSSGEHQARVGRIPLNQLRPLTDSFDHLADEVVADFTTNKTLIRTLGDDLTPAINRLEMGICQLENAGKGGVKTMSPEQEEALISQIQHDVACLTEMTAHALHDAESRHMDQARHTDQHRHKADTE